MRNLVAAAIGALVLVAGAGAAMAQSDEGFDGLSISGAAGSWQCNKIRIPANASVPSILITGIRTTNCSLSGCAAPIDATGDADLYVYNSTATGSAPSTTAGTYTCRPYLTGNEETCSVTSSTSDKYYWACVHAYTAITPIQLRSKYNGASIATGTVSETSTVEYMDYWKNNLFLGVAYHRIGCLTGSVAVLSSQDYDGFSNGNYCVAGHGWQSPSQFGGSSSTTYLVSLNMEAVYGVQSFTTMKSNADKCSNGTGSGSASTLSDGRVVTGANVTYNTPDFAYRSGTCRYNVFTNCNSDCWIRNFSNCLDGSSGSGIPIASPCW